MRPISRRTPVGSCERQGPLAESAARRVAVVGSAARLDPAEAMAPAAEVPSPEDLLSHSPRRCDRQAAWLLEPPSGAAPPGFAAASARLGAVARRSGEEDALLEAAKASPHGAGLRAAIEDERRALRLVAAIDDLREAVLLHMTSTAVG
jgi:hypothetical protein